MSQRGRTGNIVTRVRGGLALALCGLFFVPAALAVVPKAKRVVTAAARANRTDQRASALRFILSMQIGDAEPIAEGELVTHPTGLARLELRAPGLVERHLLLGSEHSAARNGLPLEAPRSFLPPLFLLQADSASILKTAMKAFGVEREYIGLAPCGDDDCYVIGDPAHAVNGPVEPPPGGAGAAPERAGSASFFGGQGDGGPTENDGATGASGNANTFASVWVGAEDFEIKQIRSLGGVVVEFGPLMKHGKLLVPAWWVVVEADKRPVRFNVAEVSVVNAPAGAFTEEWILAALPPDAPSPPSADREIPPTP